MAISEDESFIKKLFAKEEEQSQSMKPGINNLAEKAKEEAKQITEVVLKLLLAAAYLILLIYFVLKPLIEFFVMIEHYIYANIMKYLFY